MISNPQLLILDESTNALDENNERSFLDEVKKNKNNLITIIVSHNEKTLNICNKIINI